MRCNSRCKARLLDAAQQSQHSMAHLACSDAHCFIMDTAIPLSAALLGMLQRFAACSVTIMASCFICCYAAPECMIWLPHAQQHKLFSADHLIPLLLASSRQPKDDTILIHLCS